MNRFTLTILIASIFSIMAMSVAASERLSTPDYREYGDASSNRASVKDFLDQYKSAWAKQDVDALMQLHSDDTEWINAFARIFQNKSDLSHFLKNKMFPNFDISVSEGEMKNLRWISTRYINDTSAILHLATAGNRGVSRDGNESLRRNYFHLVVVKQVDGWKVVHTVIMDART
jgi:ketosteroid isomerase-like protein